MTSRSAPTAGGAPLIAVATAVALTGCSTDRFVDLNTLYAESEPWELATNARETTDQLCSDPQPDCVQALSTDQANYRKFDSRHAAEAWEEQVRGSADVRRTDAIVLEFVDSSLSDQDKNEILEGVAGAHDSNV